MLELEGCRLSGGFGFRNPAKIELIDDISLSSSDLSSYDEILLRSGPNLVRSC